LQSKLFGIFNDIPPFQIAGYVRLVGSTLAWLKLCVLTPKDIFNALERIALGLEKKDAVMSEQKKKLVAYHEAGQNAETCDSSQVMFGLFKGHSQQHDDVFF